MNALKMCLNWKAIAALGLVAGEGGVYRSSDRGAGWEELGPGVPMALIAVNGSDEQELVAIALSGQVYRSNDSGESWL